MQIFSLPLNPLAFFFSCLGFAFVFLMPAGVGEWGSLLSGIAGVIAALLAVAKFIRRYFAGRDQARGLVSSRDDLLSKLEREAASHLPVPDRYKPVAEFGIKTGVDWLIGRFKKKKK